MNDLITKNEFKMRNKPVFVNKKYKTVCGYPVYIALVDEEFVYGYVKTNVLERGIKTLPFQWLKKMVKILTVWAGLIYWNGSVFMPLSKTFVLTYL